MVIYLLLFSSRLLISAAAIDYDEIRIEDEYETRSRILMVDGNVWLHAGKDKNITFKTTGNGKIYVEDTDVSRLPDTVRKE
ncbi:unnamed protein product [Caenorhabditis sp. 36 PRJEB53466]|nr:unnamed protein product [Caenorhabditis sp. 36 PRJEB53466]